MHRRSDDGVTPRLYRSPSRSFMKLRTRGCATAAFSQIRSLGPCVCASNDAACFPSRSLRSCFRRASLSTPSSTGACWPCSSTIATPQFKAANAIYNVAVGDLGKFGLRSALLRIRDPSSRTFQLTGVLMTLVSLASISFTRSRTPRVMRIPSVGHGDSTCGISDELLRRG